MVIEVANSFCPLPAVESRGRQPEDSVHRSEPQSWLGPFDGTKKSRLRLAVWKTTFREIHIEGPEEGNEEPDDSPELLDPPAQEDDLCLKVQRILGQHIDGDSRATWLPNPAGRGRSRNAAAGGQGYVAGASDEVAEPVVVGLL